MQNNFMRTKLDVTKLLSEHKLAYFYLLSYRIRSLYGHESDTYNHFLLSVSFHYPLHKVSLT